MTPKAYLLFDHMSQQVIDFGGIADKVEYYMEKAHQISKKLDHFTSHLKSNEYNAQTKYTDQTNALHCVNDVQEQITVVNQLLKRNFYNTYLRVETSKKKRKIVRMQERGIL